MKLKRMFTNDQLRALLTDSIRSRHWDNETIIKALRLKFACGERGYEELRKQNIPLPSIRTLQNRLQGLKFSSGISDEIFEFLKLKIPNFENERDKECSLSMDEMSIVSGTKYDTSTHSFIGHVTLPDHTGTATHALVFMLAGVASRWKQIVGYYFTGDGFNGAVLKPIILQIIQKAESIGLRVNNITSDMGPANVALWREFGITAGRYITTVNKFQHPCDSQRQLYIVPDVSHLLKNLKACLINNKFIKIPSTLQEKYKLPTNIVHFDHFVELLEQQKDLEFLLTPKLHKSYVQCDNQFSKMRVNRAKNVLSTDVSSALEFLADENNAPQYIATAWFVKIIATWFTLMTARRCSVALGKLYIDKFNENVSFLHECIYLFKHLTVGSKGQFKPVQRGIIIATTSIIELTQFLLEERAFQFVYTARFTQDCVENLFSVIRSKNPVPNALQFKNNLKLICISLYIRNIPESNYEEDDANYLSGFLDVIISKKETPSCNNNIDSTLHISVAEIPTLNNIEMNILYNIAGYIIHSLQKNTQLCKKCIRSVCNIKGETLYYDKLVRIRCYKKNTLFHVNKATLDMFLQMEHIFRQYQKQIKSIVTYNVKMQLEQLFTSYIKCNFIPNCHNLQVKIYNKYATFRCKIACTKRKEPKKHFDSKTMAMHTI